VEQTLSRDFISEVARAAAEFVAKAAPQFLSDHVGADLSALGESGQQGLRVPALKPCPGAFFPDMLQGWWQ